MNPEDFVQPEMQPDGVRTYHRIHIEPRGNELWLVEEDKPARLLKPEEYSGVAPSLAERLIEEARLNTKLYREWYQANDQLLKRNIEVPYQPYYLGH